MSGFSGPKHVYLRKISHDQPSSLVVLGEQIAPGSTVLDVGTGSGELGRYLSEERSCVVDGVTYSEQEAALARPFYRQIVLADLESLDLETLFPSGRYDFIVCADVLEHLRNPDRVLRACHTLLSDAGKLLISVPNTAYCGLIGELLAGEFMYRTEGLLDRTHLRFFTRRSLLRLLNESNWHVEAIHPLIRNIVDSEFQPLFQALPPAVSRYLLALPDSSAYQFIVRASARPEAHGTSITHSPAVETLAVYSTQLFAQRNGCYHEDYKLLAAARIGENMQWVEFDLSQFSHPPERLRFDPADRPGLMRLHAIQLVDENGSLHWEWDTLAASLNRSDATDVTIHPMPWPANAGALLHLTGNDPHFELPIDEQTLLECRNGRLRIALSWPMSADCLLFAQRFADQQVLSQQLQNKLAEQTTLAETNATLHRTAAERCRNAEERCRKQANDIRRLHEQVEELQQHLEQIHNSTVFRATRPLVRLKMRLDALLKQPADSPPSPLRPALQPVAPPSAPVDVIVPVYRGLADTRRCIESILNATAVRTPYRLVIINDASPEPDLTQWLRTLGKSADSRIILLENENNLGFVGTANRGMSLSQTNDVVLLNSDTEVAGNWLDRLQSCAYSNPLIGTVTPASNNATICSYPRFCGANELPNGFDTAQLDAIFANTNAGHAVEIPTGIGFCLYIKRDCLVQTGLFDEEHFGKGYGEENDFCMRARSHGWRHLYALDTFVRHSGGVSFGAQKSPRERQAQHILRKLHPRYESLVHKHIEADPARPYRLAVDLARIRASERPAILMVSHQRGGGTHRHVQELVDLLQDRFNAFLLQPGSGGDTLLSWANKGEAFELAFKLPDEFEPLIQALQALRVVHVHIHHLLGHHALVESLPRRLDLPYDFTAHDYYTICPQISLTGQDNAYCGEEGTEQCRQCLQRSPAPAAVDIVTWRTRGQHLLEGARHVFTPSEDAAVRLKRAAPLANIVVAPHTDLSPHSLSEPAPQPGGIGTRPLRIVVIGALSPIKGADMLEEVACIAAQQRLALDFHLIGYAYRALRGRPRANLTIHGEYRDEDLPELLAWLQPDLAWFPARWPETYSYTLSACLQAGLPIVAPNLGAFPERLAGRCWTWIEPWNLDASAFVALFERLRIHHFAPGLPPEPAAKDRALQTASFDYLRDYIAQTPPLSPAPELDIEFLQTYRPGRNTGIRRLTTAIKQQTLGIIVRLRSAPLLSRIAQRIPLRWQTRLKTWLQG